MINYVILMFIWQTTSFFLKKNLIFIVQITETRLFSSFENQAIDKLFLIR